ncbi:hypothetical protein GOP47_0030281 [Adiantum capillus-veneris]|nr:hypothetical protein GOP47_0030281 [Adiantum capillus-veneris]
MGKPTRFGTLGTFEKPKELTTCEKMGKPTRFGTLLDEESRMTRDISGSQSYLNRPDPSLEKLVGHLRSPKCATLKVAKKRYTCIAQHQDSSAGSTEEETALFGEELPSVYDCICVLKSCRKSKQVAHAKAVHVHLCKNGLEDQTDLGNLLVTVLLESGGRTQAFNLFKRLHERNELSWTALIQDLVDSSEFQGSIDKTIPQAAPQHASLEDVLVAVPSVSNMNS